MKSFTEHPETVGENWLQHCKFSCGVGIRLLASSILFIIHGLFPFISIPEQLNLDYTSKWLEVKNVERQIKKK